MTPEISFPIHYFAHKQKNINFTGRFDELRILRRSLGDGKAVAITQAITGLGGVGKTQLALDYSYDHKDEYDLIYWLHADDAISLEDGLLALGALLGLLRLPTGNRQGGVQTTLAWLRQTERLWLLVYDNADMIAPQTLRAYLPEGGRERGHILITSRNPALRTLAEPLPLHIFTEDDALSFLARRTGKLDDTRLAPLAAGLGYFPLALEHAAAYIEETGCSANAYLDLYTRVRPALLAELVVPDTYHATIMSTWQLAFEQVQKTAGAAELLNVCTFLAGEGIDLSWLQQGKAVFAPMALGTLLDDPLAVDKAVAALRRFTLLTRRDTLLTMHGMVQMVARERLGSEKRQQWLQMSVDLLADVYDFDEHDMATWAEAGRLLPHLRAVLRLAKEAELETARVAYLNSQVGFYLEMFGNYAETRPYYEHALTVYEKVLGVDDPKTATSLNNLGSLLHTMGAYAEARPYMERALVIFEKELGANHPNVATLNNNLGQLLDAMGAYEEARPYMERALAIWEKALGANHPQVATGNNNLGTLLHTMGAYGEARPYMERALAIDEKALGSEHPSVAIRLNNLGQLWKAMGAYEEARPYMERALAIDEKALGAEHPSVAIRLNNLGMLLDAMGAYEEARPYLERALAIDEKALGAEHPGTAIDLNNLGTLLHTMGAYAEARPYLERALAIFEASLGAEHPHTKVVRGNFAALLAKMGENNQQSTRK